MTEFKWPCDRRDAHHSHRTKNGARNDKWCPGVPAHPATQIGGAYKRY